MRSNHSSPTAARRQETIPAIARGAERDFERSFAIIDGARAQEFRGITAEQLDDARAFRRHAGNVLHRTPPVRAEGSKAVTASPSDFDLNPDAVQELAGLGDVPPKLAAVLIPIIVARPLRVLLTVRSDHLPSHAGQISFPGGKLEPEDSGPAAAAIREAREEIGLQEKFIDPLGYLDWYRSGSGYAISPLVAFIEPGYTLEPDPAEVTEIFEVPLAFLLDAANHQRHSRVRDGRQRHYHAMPYGERYIWGVTAGIIKNLHERLTGA